MNKYERYRPKNIVTAKKMAKELRRFADALEGKVIRRKPPKSQVAAPVCHNCKHFVREEGEEGDEYAKYVDGVCTCPYVEGRKIRELYEGCSRYTPVPNVDLRAEILKHLDYLGRMVNKMHITPIRGKYQKIAQERRSTVYETRNKILQTHILTREHYDEYCKAVDDFKDIFRELDIEMLEKQWNPKGEFER